MANTIAKRKKTTRRKTGAAPARKRKTKKVAGMTPATISIGGVRFKKSACSLTKAEAKKKAEAHRAKGKGKGARVIPNKSGTGYCLYKRG